jgi:hypothetical protein
MADKGEASMAKWDYQVLEIAPDDERVFQHSLQTTLKKNGDQGWELINMIPSPGREGALLLVSKKRIEHHAASGAGA